MPFDGGLMRADRSRVPADEPKDLADLVAEAIERLSPPRRAETFEVELPSEPPLLTLWKRVAAHRDVLARQITSWEQFRHRQRRGHRRVRDQHRELGIVDGPISIAIRERSDRMLTEQIEELHAQLTSLDRALKGLRPGAGKRDLEKLARGFQERLIKVAVERVDAFVNDKEAGENSETTRFLAVMALLQARDGSPRLLDDEADAEQARADRTVNLERLLEEQRVDRKLNVRATRRNRSVWIVAKVVGVSPNSRAFRR